MQVYAPVEDPTGEAFHRTIFLFVSPQGDSLATPGAVRAFRCQLPHHNRYYGLEPALLHDLTPPPLTAADEAAVVRLDPWGVAEAERQPPTSSSSQIANLLPGFAANAPPLPGSSSSSPGMSHPTSSGGGPTALPSGVRLYTELELLVEPEDREGGYSEGLSADPDGDMDMGEGRSGGGGGASAGGGSGGKAGGADVARLLQEYEARVATEGEFADEELKVRGLMQCMAAGSVRALSQAGLSTFVQGKQTPASAATDSSRLVRKLLGTPDVCLL